MTLKRKSEPEGKASTPHRKKAKGDTLTTSTRGDTAKPAEANHSAAQPNARRRRALTTHPESGSVPVEQEAATGAGDDHVKRGGGNRKPTPGKVGRTVFSPNWQQLKATLPSSKHRRDPALRVASAPSKSMTAETSLEGIDEQVIVKRPQPLSNNTSLTKLIAIDCEMVGVGHEGVRSILAHICIVNSHGNVVYQKHVRPLERVTDYRTFVSGIRAKDIQGPNAEDFWEVQKEVSEILKGRILVGHAVHNDLKALLVSHPKKDMRDTMYFKPLKGPRGQIRALKVIAKEILGLTIQEGEHSPVEDARAALFLYLRFRKSWEQDVMSRPRGDKRKGKRW